MNLLHLGAGERVSEVLPVRNFGEGGYVVLATRLGTIKKTSLDAYSSPRRGGIIAINIHEGDELIGAVRTGGDAEILIATQGGKAIITIKTTARNGQVVGILQVADEDEVMLVTDAGKIIRTRVGGIPVMGRNTQGVRVMETAKGERVVSIARIAEVEDAPPEPAGTAAEA